MRDYIKKCLEEHLCDFDLDGIEITEEDVDSVERLISKKEFTLNNAVEAVLIGIFETLA